MRFFFYGTLLDHDVTALVLGRRLPPAAFMPASLPGHARRRVKSATYPIVVRDPRGEVPGAIVGGLSARDVARLADLRRAALSHRAAASVRISGRDDHGVGVRAGAEPPSAERRAMGSGALAAPPQAGVRRPPEARAQRAPGVFQAVTWIAEQ